MVRPTPITGFPEWLPSGRMLEQEVIRRLQQVFELHGFAPIETRAVEPMTHLARKGEIDKEIYVLNRLQAKRHDTGKEDSKKQLGLHFDLTVPLARYVLENAGKLDFPFKRYQIQKVWRGERPQDGRFREFLQADIDIVGHNELPFHYEVELPLVMAEALQSLPIPPIRIHVNNRKIVEGFYRGIGITKVADALRIIDKLDKIGSERVRGLLCEADIATAEQADMCLQLASIRGDDGKVIERVCQLGVSNELLDEGLAELGVMIDRAARRAPGVLLADLKIARGLDYYTGSVFETVLLGHEQLGSICSGGRYDALATDGSTSYPGVGLSIGVSRLISRVFAEGMAYMSRPVPTAVLVAVDEEEQREISDQVAFKLRARGIPADVAPTAAKYGKQIKYADRRGIPFVWFPGVPGEVKDIRTGEQIDADVDTWSPTQGDLWPHLITPEGVESPPRNISQ